MECEPGKVGTKASRKDSGWELPLMTEGTKKEISLRRVFREDAPVPQGSCCLLGS